MSLPFTSVVSLHQDPYTCGVAKFSRELAKRLQIPFVPLSPDPNVWGSYPLLSLKWSELEKDHIPYTRHHCFPLAEDSSAEVMRTAKGRTYGVFWHDAGDPYVTEHAQHVFYADPSLGPTALWCPALIPNAPPRIQRLFSFGMSHKLKVHFYERAAELLDQQGIDYHLRVSVGLHEGTRLSDAYANFDRLRDALGPEHVTILGILSDEAVAEEIRDCDAVLAFFDYGARANNTTLHAALQAGKHVVTNHDHQTPGFIKASTKDILTMEGWQPQIPYYYGWDRFLEKLTEVYATTAHR